MIKKHRKIHGPRDLTAQVYSGGNLHQVDSAIVLAKRRAILIG